LRQDFQAMIDRRNAGSGMREKLPAQADILFAHWPKVRDGMWSRRWFRRTHVDCLREQVRLLLACLSGCGTKTACVRRQLLTMEASLGMFVGQDSVRPTNNADERAMRHAVCWRTTSNGTDNTRRSRFVERILTVVASCRRQSRVVLIPDPSRKKGRSRHYCRKRSERLK